MGWEPMTYCRDCGEPFDVYQAPDERVCDNCKEINMQCPDCGELRHIGSCEPKYDDSDYHAMVRVPESDDQRVNRLAALIENIPGVMAKPTMPSRDFLVRQAVLNAMKEQMPFTLAADGSASLGRHILKQSEEYALIAPLPRHWDQSIRRHFRKLVAQYGGTTCPAN